MSINNMKDGKTLIFVAILVLCAFVDALSGLYVVL